MSIPRWGWAALILLAIVAPSGTSGCEETRPPQAPAPPPEEEHPYDPVVPGVPAAMAEGVDADPGVPKPEAVPIAGSPLVRARATVMVRAPLQRVHDTLVDLAHYAGLVPRFKTSTLVDTRASGSRDGYVEVEAPEGVMRMQVEMARPAVAADGSETIEIRSYKGNVRTFEMFWRIRKGNRGALQLSVDVFVDPGVGVPAEVLNKENLARAVEAVVAVRDRLDRRR